MCKASKMPVILPFLLGFFWSKRSRPETHQLAVSQRHYLYKSGRIVPDALCLFLYQKIKNCIKSWIKSLPCLQFNCQKLSVEGIGVLLSFPCMRMPMVSCKDLICTATLCSAFMFWKILFMDSSLTTIFWPIMRFVHLLRKFLEDPILSQRTQFYHRGSNSIPEV